MSTENKSPEVSTDEENTPKGKFFPSQVDGVADTRDCLENCIRGIETMYQNPGATHPSTIGTGFDDLDICLLGNGLPKGGLTIIAGKPRVGKTAFALALATYGAVKPLPRGETPNTQREHIGIPTFFVTPSTTKERLTTRMMCQQSYVSLHTVLSGRIREHSWPCLIESAANIAKAPFWIDDTPGIVIETLCERARRMKEKHDIQALYLDYLQLVETLGIENRYAEISRISRQLKALAKELDIAVVAVSTLNRARLMRNPLAREPILEDLRDSGTLEDDADLILFVHRESLDCPDCNSSERVCLKDHENAATIIIGKQSGGPVRRVSLSFRKKIMVFSNPPE